jgi:hypothetical protein
MLMRTQIKIGITKHAKDF